jgi:hypothetical protein
MKRWIIGFAVLVVLGSVGQIKAVTYNDGGIHDLTTTIAGPVYTDAGPLGSTTLNVSPVGTVFGGDAIGAAGAYGIVSDIGGIVNILGGVVSGGNASGDNAHAYGIKVNGGTANLWNGTVSGGNAGGNASSNAHTYGIEVWDGTLNMSGGTVFGGDAISSSSNAHTYGIYVGIYGTVNFSGGIVSVGTDYGTSSDNTSVHGILNNGGIVNITGGTVLNGTPSANPDAFGIHNDNGGELNIFGTDFNVPYGQITDTINFHLTGTLANGSVIDTWVDNLSISNPHITKISKINILSPVPEPSTLVLLGMGLFGFIAWTWRQRRKAI